MKHLKVWILGLAAIQKKQGKAKVKADLVEKGDANTKYFQIMANTRKKKNFIYSLQTDHGTVTTQADKQWVVYDYFM
jgi:hypothetical protein